MMPDKTRPDTAWFTVPGQEKPEGGSISANTRADIGAASHPGQVQPTNEDSFLVMLFTRSLHPLLTNLPAGHLPTQYNERGYAMFVADGIGGRTAGEVASQTVISSLVELFIETPDWIMRPDEERVSEVLRRMEERFGQLTEALTKRARLEPHLYGMGTTLTMAISLGSDLVITHVGDSRAYLFRMGKLWRLTSDHTVAQLLADVKAIRPEQVSKHHARHVLTDALTAGGEKAEVELHHMKLMDGDRLLLCTDGLTEMIPDEDIAAVLEKDRPAEETCRILVDRALDAGAMDNVTVLLSRYHIKQ